MEVTVVMRGGDENGSSGVGVMMAAQVAVLVVVMTLVQMEEVDEQLWRR